MPLYKTIKTTLDGKILIWKITESLADLHHRIFLTEKSSFKLHKMKSDIHKKGFMAVRQLLLSEGYSDSDLYYNEEGKPFLRDKTHISITHSFEFVGIMLNKASEVGIDIEKVRPKIGRIASKFLGYENLYLQNTSSNYIEKLTVIWCIKESLYKFSGKENLNFKENALIIPFEIADLQTKAWIDFKDEKIPFTACFLPLENFYCAYVIPENK